MFDKLIAITFLSMGIGSNLNAPSRVLEPLERSIMNSTSYDIHFFQEMNIHSHTEAHINTESAPFWTNTFIDIFSDDKPTDIYYWVNQVDNEAEVPCVFSDSGGGRFTCDLPDLSGDTVRGIQFFQRKSIVGETYYLLNGDISNLSSFNSGNLIEGKTATIENHGVTSLSWSRTKVDKGLTAYVSWNANGSTVANNSMTNGGTSVEELTNIVLYNNGWSNRITFTSGYYSRAYNTLGYAEINESYFSREFVGYASRTSSGDISISLEPMVVGFDLVSMALSSIGSFLSYMVAPGITIGVLLMVPVILTLLLFVLKMIKKG